MRKFLGTLVIVALLVAAVGFYRGWFGVTSDRQADETNVELTINKQRIKHDAEAASEKARALAGRVERESSDLTREESESVNEQN